MKLRLLSLALAFFLVVLSAGSIAELDCSSPDEDLLSFDSCDQSAVDCSLPDADLLFPDECGVSVDCSLPDADLLFPDECGIQNPPCTLGFWDVGDWQPSVCPPAGVQTRSVTLMVGAACDVNNPDTVMPEQTRPCTYYVPSNNPPEILSFLFPPTAQVDSMMFIPVTARDADSGVLKIEFLDSSGSVISSFDCGNTAQCSATFSVAAPSISGVTYTFSVRATDAGGLVASETKSGITIPQPSPPVCTPAVSCSYLGCGVFDSCGNYCGACPPAPVNNPPVINTFSVPATADKNSDVTLSVTATDSDGGVNRIEILKDSSVIATQSCGNVVSCTKSFVVRVPDAFDTVYTFVARVFDGLGAVITQSGSGRTNSAPVTPPPVPPPVQPEPQPAEVLEPVKVSIPSAEFFVSTAVPDTGCVAPGAETFLYVALKNNGKAKLNDIKITAIVDELGIRAVSGPFSMRKGDSASRFIYFEVPEDAEPGDYYIRVSVTSNKDSIVKYRVFEVNKAC